MTAPASEPTEIDAELRDDLTGFVRLGDTTHDVSARDETRLRAEIIGFATATAIDLDAPVLLTTRTPAGTEQVTVHPDGHTEPYGVGAEGADGADGPDGSEDSEDEAGADAVGAASVGSAASPVTAVSPASPGSVGSPSSVGSAPSVGSPASVPSAASPTSPASPTSAPSPETIAA
ncbi:MAG: hypothetical protein ABW040_10625, partial [Microbacteriaceae bacterium]